MTVYCDVRPCSLVNGCEPFEEPALTYRKEAADSSKRREYGGVSKQHGVTFQITVILIPP
jgi:hypothetical protein